MFNKKIDSHEVLEKNNETNINYNKKFFKSNKLCLSIYIYIFFTAFILSKIVVSHMTIFIGIQYFFSFVLSTVFLFA